jgi:hypothetical protein
MVVSPHPLTGMLKLYRRQGDRVTHYHEAWVNKGIVIEHWGELGTRGAQKNHPIKQKSDGEEILRAVLKPALDAGFEPINADRLQIVLVQYKINGFGSVEDLKKRHELEDRLNETLGWTGLGHVDGGSIGSNTMEAACFVVDVEVAKRVLAEDLRGTKFGDYYRIHAGGAG